jgi:uncharacterized protein YjdB
MKKTHSIRAICCILTFLLLSLNTQVFADTTASTLPVSLNKTTDVLAVGETDNLIATINSTVTVNGTTPAVTWVSSDTSIVNVFNGIIMAVRTGTAVVTAVTSIGTASCIVTVTNPVTTISLNKTSDILDVGITDTLIATVSQVSMNQTTAVNQTVNWTSSNPNVVLVSGGVISAVSPGNAVITATTAGAENVVTCYVTVNSSNPLMSIVLNKKADFLQVGGTDVLTASVIATASVNQAVTWSSSDSNIVKVVEGVIVGLSPGTANITATTADGSQSATCTVTVNKLNTPVTSTESISINKTTDTLNVGGADTLTVTANPATVATPAVNWVSSNPNIVTVTNGVITAISAGNAVITAVSTDGTMTATCNVTVNNPILSTINTIRLGGADRYATSVAISQAGWKGTSSYAVLASGSDFPDGLSSATLAKKYNAPVLLTTKDSIPQNVLNEIKRLQVSHIFIIGGTGVVSQAVENELNAMNITTERFGGADRYATSVQIAEKLGVTSGEIIVANGYEWSDALSAAAIAAAKGIPMILTDNNVLPDSVRTFIGKSSFTKTYILGDTDLISNSVANMFPGIQRITGSNEYERNINIISTFESGIDFSNICIASGRDFPDSISGSALAAMNSSAVVLVDDSNIQAVTSQYIKEKLFEVKNVYIFGLQGAVNDTAIQTLFNK